MSTEFRIRRRKRAIDPSLGYYLEDSNRPHQLSQPAKGTNANGTESESNTTADTVSRLVNEDHRSLSKVPMVTVNDFLRIYAHDNTKHKHARRKNKLSGREESANPSSQSDSYLRLRSRNVKRTKLSNEQDSSSESEMFNTDSFNKDISSRPKKYKNQNQNFRQRIYEAAIATSVEPLAALVQPKDTPASRPLLYFEHIPSSPHVKQVGFYRRTNPFQPSVFDRTIDHNKIKLPLTRWRTSYPNNLKDNDRDPKLHVPQVNIQSDNKRERVEDTSLPCMYPSLDFVTVSQAEGAYRTLFPRHNVKFERATDHQQQ